MKKKYFVTSKDKKDWNVFAKHMEDIGAKDVDFTKKNIEINKLQRLDLHGFSLIEANKILNKFITQSFDRGYKKLLVVTGKGLRSKAHNNPYISEKLSMLKYSVPEYIKNNENLNQKISRISQANLKDGGEGAIYIFLKNYKKFTR